LENAGIAPHILNLGTRWKYMVSFMPSPLYHPGISHWYPLDRRPGGSQSQSECGEEEKKIPSLPLQGMKPWSFSL